MTKRIHSDLPEFNVFIKERLRKKAEDFDGTREMFAKAAGISRSSLTRYMNGHCTRNSPSAKNMLAFVSSSDGGYQSLLLHYFPNEADDFKRMYIDTNSKMVPSKVLDYIEDDPVYYNVYSHSGLDYGMPLNTVYSTWGNLGMKKGQQLVNDGFLKLEEKRFVRINKKASYGNLDTVKKAALWNIRDFSLENIYNEQGAIGVVLDNLNEAGLERVRKLCLSNIAEIAEIADNPEYKGSIPFSYTVVAGKTICSGEYEKHVQEIIADEEKKNEK